HRAPLPHPTLILRVCRRTCDDKRLEGRGWPVRCHAESAAHPSRRTRFARAPQDDGVIGAHSTKSHFILLISVPIFSIHSFTVSPALRNSLRAAPTPAGVPVMITSPGCSVMREESWAICSLVLKIIWPELESCLITSLTHSFMPRLCGSPMSEAGTI